MNRFDPVDKPHHYTSHPSGLECIVVAEHFSFSLGNTIKYIWRHEKKGGIEDLRKARWYLDREIARLQEHHDTDRPPAPPPPNNESAYEALTSAAQGNIGRCGMQHPTLASTPCILVRGHGGDTHLASTGIRWPGNLPRIGCGAEGCNVAGCTGAVAWCGSRRSHHPHDDLISSTTP